VREGWPVANSGRSRHAQAGTFANVCSFLDFGGGISLTAVTGVQAARSHDYAVDCNQTPLGAITYFDVGISAVALSPD